MMKGSRSVSIAALIVLIGAAAGASLSQTISAEPKASIQAQGTPSLPDVRHRLDEVGRRLQQARLITSTHSVRLREATTGRR
jgi:hypothetical protein